MKKITLLPMVLLSLCATAQRYTRTNTGLTTTVGGIHMEVQFFSPRIVRILKSPQHISFAKESLSVIKKPGTTHLDITQQGNIVHIKSNAIEAAVNLQTGSVSYSDPAGNILFSEKEHGTKFTATQDAGNSTYTVRQAFQLEKDEAIYGLGQQQNGQLNQRGQTVFLRQENMKVCIPFFQSIKGYGVFWDNYSPTTFTDTAAETTFDSQVGNCADYYFLYGGSADGVVAQMRNLTGQAPMMPLWVYGFNQSRERYKTQYELVDVVKRYRDLQVPLDGIIQDWQYWGKDSNWNAMAFAHATFPAPQSMVDSVHLLHAHQFIVAWPGFGPLTPQYAALKSKHLLLDFETYPPDGGPRPYDPYNPVARDIYWRYLAKVFALGIDGWWLDSSEPDHVNLKEQDFDLPTYLGTFRSVRNAFPLTHVSGVYDHQRAASSAKRVTILTRSAFAGQQRYAANTWSGDVRSDWQTFRKQIPAGLNLSLSGIPYWNTDIGGFFAGSYVKDGGAKNPEFQELYTRWLQFAAFTPMMRSHGTDIPREIYQFGKRGDAIFDIQEQFIHLRYSLLPYTYATAHQVTTQAGSIIRALFMDFAQDRQVYNMDNEYLYGSSLLVAPVTDKGVQHQTVYLPAGTIWYDFWTGEATAGGKTVEKPTPMNIMPLYVKAGAIIPWGPKVQYAEEKKWDNLALRIYPGADGDFTLYEDENNNYNYEKGSFTEIAFHWNDKSHTLTIADRKGQFPGMLGTRQFNIVVVSPDNGTGSASAGNVNRTVTYIGKKATVQL